MSRPVPAVSPSAYLLLDALAERICVLWPHYFAERDIIGTITDLATALGVSSHDVAAKVSTLQTVGILQGDAVDPVVLQYLAKRGERFIAAVDALSNPGHGQQQQPTATPDDDGDGGEE